MKRIPASPALAVALFLLALAAAAPLAAQPYDAIQPAMGVVVIPREEVRDGLGVLQSGPSIVTSTIGAGLSYPLREGLSLEPSLDFYWAYHLWYGRALPAEIDHRTTFTMGFVLDSPFVWRFPLSDRFTLALGAGPALHVRIGLKGADDAPLDEVALINGAFWSDGRFLMPSTLIRGEYALTDRVVFGFAARAYWPLFNIWSGSSNFLDDGIFGGALVVRYRPKAKAAPLPEPEPELVPPLVPGPPAGAGATAPAPAVPAGSPPKGPLPDLPPPSPPPGGLH